ncbi:Fic family protein [Pedobacter sp. Leaf176]|uniref:Fic family protein n=1 Tax=Pedobacter sp. Leaf176 TaxID=1736286 RepID=UPI0007012D8F|nr:Fic family protein [Pedobacter sp. Leaf176]KQR69758.1 cell filamentation protein Fic [Pedobacter sp. Leaf176]
MNFSNFKSGFWQKQYNYKSFQPTKINNTWIWDDPKINTLLEEATRQLGELNAFSYILPDVDLFIRMHVVKEANTSSRIEGTQTNMDEALMKKEDITPSKRDDWQEVRNYIDALNYSIEELSTFPLSNRLIRKTHQILLSDVRGNHKMPGEFRTSQNWIGGSSIADAIFVPPHPSEVSDLMGNLEQFLHNEEINVPHLIKIALAHYQFETIHPFLDGNGRIGRLLITLYLVSAGLLKKPSLYLSDFFEKHKSSYYDALTHVRNTSDIIHWIKFFLSAVVETAKKGKDTFSKILELKDEIHKLIITFGKKAESAQKLINHLYSNPFVNLSDVMGAVNLSKQSANQLIKDFLDKEILVEVTGNQRNRIFYFKRYYILFIV